MTMKPTFRPTLINGLFHYKPEPPSVDAKAVIERLLRGNQHRGYDHGMTGCLQVFAGFFDARAYKRMAAEALLICIRFREGNFPRKGWQWWFDRAQRFRLKAMELGR